MDNGQTSFAVKKKSKREREVDERYAREAASWGPSFERGELPDWVRDLPGWRRPLPLSLCSVTNAFEAAVPDDRPSTFEPDPEYDPEVTEVCDWAPSVEEHLELTMDRIDDQFGDGASDGLYESIMLERHPLPPERFRLVEFGMDDFTERIRVASNNARDMKGGTLTVAQWTEIRAAFDGCAYCGGALEGMELDHVVPISRGGRTNADNVVPACFSCNRSKGARLVGEWLSPERADDFERHRALTLESFGGLL